MRTMLEYIERAKLQCEPPNQEGLAKALGINKSAFYAYKNNMAYPNEDVMILMGIMAGVKPEQAIIDLMNIKAQNRSNESVLRRVSIINEYLGINDEKYKNTKTHVNALWNTR